MALCFSIVARPYYYSFNRVTHNRRFNSLNCKWRHEMSVADWSIGAAIAIEFMCRLGPSSNS